jgi:hypothetical protein
VVNHRQERPQNHGPTSEQDRLEVSVVVESYNYAEGSGLDRLALALRAATRMVNEHERGEVLLTDASGSPEIADLLERDFRQVRRIEAAGLEYDVAKALAAANASGDYVLYLDGDCIPGWDWLEAHLNRLRRGEVATGGFTRYEGGFLPAVCTVMDFGFLLPRGERILSCYASNNSGFRRALLAEAPVPEGPMRCRCYGHAQLLKQRNTPVRMAPDAIVHHEFPHFFPERLRQGYDAVAACWVNPALPEARWLWLGPLLAPALYTRNVALDWRRLLRGWRDLGLRRWQAALALPLFPILRLVDLCGMVQALTARGRPPAEHGFCASR